MSALLTRRAALVGSMLAGAGMALTARRSQAAVGDATQARLIELEARHGGRLGVSVLDTGSGQRTEHRANERFAMCSTFKLLAAAMVLERVDRNEERLDRRILFGSSDVVDYSPATGPRAGGEGMTMGEVCEAAMTLSDNTAGNLMLNSFGGPAAVTTYARGLGDTVTRLDRMETALNEAATGDPRDTTSPAAMVDNLARLTLGPALSEPSRAQLITWMVANRTGDRRLRAGFPDGWRVGDKTGTGGNGTAADIGVVWRPDRSPLVIAVYCAEVTASAERRNALFEQVARVISAVP
ncbi:beta-lactamase class A [Stella humosa]|uniref:Beta-lactamase n=1 Tax=Stella humosa TaxID=94 RepID=A0A3N1L1Y6_9PROT|nr:class A beta-lactamase [Stella humosa]ROP84476.1 beta-lactamase class A [Stella humosa]BBK33995.1 beta-lactamase [Stella humosa]